MKKRISQFPRSRLNTDPLPPRVPRNITAIAIELQCVFASQCAHEFLVGLRLRATQLVIEVNNREDNPQSPAKLQQNPQQSYRIDPPGNRHTNPIPGPQELVPTNVEKQPLWQGSHAVWYRQGSAQGQPLRLSGGPKLRLLWLRTRM